MKIKTLDSVYKLGPYYESLRVLKDANLIDPLLLPKQRMREQPFSYWMERSWYRVWVAYGSHNPVHSSLLFTGFLKDGEPAGYSCLVSEVDGSQSNLVEAYFLVPRRFLFTVR